MRLYSGPVSMFGAKAEMAAIEKGVQVEVQFVPFSLRTLYEPKHPEVLRVNPKGEVPVLVDGEVEIFDSTQIFEYLESIVSENPLWPRDPVSRAQARLAELQSDEVFFPNVANLMPRRRSGLSREQLEESAGRLMAFYDEIDARLSEREHLAGQFSYADLAFYSAHFFARFLGVPESPKHRHIQTWQKRMAERSSVMAVMGRMRDYLTSHGVPAEL